MLSTGMDEKRSIASFFMPYMLWCMKKRKESEEMAKVMTVETAVRNIGKQFGK